MKSAETSPSNLNRSAADLKKNIGRLILKLNSDVLDLIVEYRKVKHNGDFSEKGKDLELSVTKKKVSLEKTLKMFESKPDFVKQEKLERFVSMVNTNISTAAKVLESKEEDNEVLLVEAQESAKEAKAVIADIEAEEEKIVNDIAKLTANLSIAIESNSDIAGDETFNRELKSIGKYKADRYMKMRKDIETKMQRHHDDLKEKWEKEKDIIDHQALKDIRLDFEATHKKCRYMVSEWEKKKLSEILTDELVDIIDNKFDEYMASFQKMNDIKTTEAARLRKKSTELEEYKKEKRRAIPTWPKALPYSKFKPDLISWDEEHYLTSGSVKFGLLVEMLKSFDRISTFEQIQVRLGKQRNDKDIISQIVKLLDTINEETVYNKISSAWEEIVSFKKTEGQTLNEFFSKFETLQYSLNLADNSYTDFGSIVEGEDFQYYKKREEMNSKRLELGDKLKSVILIKALGVDATYKRDILSKINFDKNPSEVYNDTKTAIRDICGKLKVQNCDNGGSEHTEVNVVKPWQDRGRSPYQNKGREIRDRKEGYRYRSGSFRGGNRSFSRERSSR